MTPINSANAVNQDWYRKNRQAVEAFFAEGNLTPESEEVNVSPFGKYRLVVSDYRGDRRSRGRVYRGDTLLADVKRNYGHFPFVWCESHLSGHDYLFCGEDYQGQTVIELDTGERIDYIHEAARGGGGFCCTGYYPAPDRKLIVVEGCVWACPYELLFCGFNNPMNLPWPIIDRVLLTGEAQGWTDDGFVFESAEDVRLTDLKPYDEFTEREEEEFWQRRLQIGGQRIRRYRRASDGSTLLLGERVMPTTER